MECVYLSWPSPVHSLSLQDCKKASTGTTPPLWVFFVCLFLFFIKNLNPSPSTGSRPTPQGSDFCGIYSPPTRFQMLSHCSKSARNSEVSTASQDTAFIAYFTQIRPHLHPHNLDGTPVSLGPLWCLHFFKRASCMLSLYFSQ